MDVEEIKQIKESDKSKVLLVREKNGERLFIQKILEGRHPVYEELLNYPHPCLPKLQEVTVCDNSTIVIEEYIDGQPLGKEPLGESQVCAAMKELCSVLEFLHAKGIIHRDVKPSNIILAADGHIRLIDFDVARRKKAELEQDTRQLGTRGYAPPEQYGFAQTDERTDIYAFGVTFEQLLGEKAQKTKYRKIIRKCTDLDPDKRFQSAKEVKKALSHKSRGIFCGCLALAAAILFGMLVVG